MPTRLSLTAQTFDQQKAENLLFKQKKSLSSTREVSPNEVRTKIDPNRTLPQINLKEQSGPEMKGTLVPHTRDIIFNGEKIGIVTVTNDTKNKVSYINQIAINENQRGRGVGLATYISVIEEVLAKGYIFRTHDWSQSKESKKIWDILVETDIAQIKENFTEDSNGKYHGVLEVFPATIENKQP